MSGIGYLFGMLGGKFYYGEWSKEKQQISEIVGAIPVASNVQDIYLDQRKERMNGKSDQQRYLDEHDMDWSDVVDPRALSSLGSSTQSFAKMTIGFVSDNVRRLYK